MRSPHVEIYAGRAGARNAAWATRRRAVYWHSLALVQAIGLLVGPLQVCGRSERHMCRAAQDRERDRERERERERRPCARASRCRDC